MKQVASTWLCAHGPPHIKIRCWSKAWLQRTNQQFTSKALQRRCLQRMFIIVWKDIAAKMKEFS